MNTVSYSLTNSRSIYDSAQQTRIEQVFSLPVGTYRCLGHLCNARIERKVCNDLQTLIWTTWKHCCQPQLYNSLPGFHSGYTAGSELVVYGRSCSVGVIVFSSCHFTTIHEAAQPTPLCRSITMPTHDMILLHLKKCCYG